MNKLLKLSVLVALAAGSSQLQAHSEHDKARFVATNGADNSSCDNVLRPCRSIAYAVSQANKGDKILVASGEYSIETSEELFFLKSQLVPVYGGYNKFDHYQSQSPNSNVTTLKNIPVTMAPKLRSKGFNVIADGKSISKDKALQARLSDYQMLSQKQTNQTCANGKAGEFECNNIDLLAHIPLDDMSSLPGSGNDIWGHVDLNDESEYAIIGLENGIAVFNVTDATNPTEVGTISGRSSTWRDIKVYQYFDQKDNRWKAYAYGTVDGTTDYVTIIDLTDLPHSISLVEKNQAVTKAHNVYISNVDYTYNTALNDKTPVLQLVGSPRVGGAFESYSLANPASITRLNNQHFGSGYTHDGSSIHIDDNRAQTTCGDQSCTIFIDFNENEMKLWDITNPEATNKLGEVSYSDVTTSQQYIHSGWGSEDNQYVFLHDEFDEQKAGLNSTVRIFSINDLDNPMQVGQWTGPTRAIDHNGFVRGNRYYISNYERGLTVLDITDAANPVEVGFFDTYTPSNSASFNGAWGVYPFLPSGNILVSDINSGLYVLRDNTKSSAVGNITFSSNSLNTAQGGTLQVSVDRLQASNPIPTSVDYEVLKGSTQDGDIVLSTGTLNWAQGDIASKSIAIDISPKTDDEELEEIFFVRLKNPTSGATLGRNSYTKVTIEGIKDRGSVDFNKASIKVAENGPQVNIGLTRIGTSSGEVTYQYQLVGGTAIVGEDVEALSGTLVWEDGDSTEKTVTVTLINDTISEPDESFTVELSSEDGSRIGEKGKITVNLLDDENNQAPEISLSENFEVNTGQSVTLSAQVTDPEDDPMEYLWSQTDGNTVAIDDVTKLSTFFVAPNSPTTLTFELVATDFRGGSSSKTVTISVIAPPSPGGNTNNSDSGGSAPLLIMFGMLILAMRRKK